MKTHHLSPHIFLKEEKLLTKNLCPGEKVYTEKLISKNGIEYRFWNPSRSKLASAILNGLSHFPFTRDSKILYLGAATGTTTSHISDVAEEGILFCIEFSPRALRELIYVSESRKNIIPILKDASNPKSYADLVSQVDIIYQDIAQKRQSEILIKNLIFLKENGYVFMCIKARSIDVTLKPKEIFEREINFLKDHLKILQTINLEPFQADHIMVVGRKK
ncbi:MAG: fibrillarin-like rRNA/tRNA 2'-O-methyltransferase [Candidatus Methanofastidiosia archaeon]